MGELRLWLASLSLFILGAAQDEDEERINRETAARASRLCKVLAGETESKAVEKAFADVLTCFTAQDINPETRDSIKADILSALKVSRERMAASIEEKVRATDGFLKLKELKVELNRRREAALKAIYDPKIYLPESHADYPKGDKVKGQEAVDALVLKASPQGVAALFEAPSPNVTLDRSFKRDADWLLESTARFLQALGDKASDGDVRIADDVYHNLAAEKIDLRTFVLDAKEADAAAWNRRVDAYNRDLADPGVGAPEKEHARVINEYREMMGRRKLFLDARLCRAAVKHSTHCNAAQKIWHGGADGDPQSRARAEGFPAPVSENVAIAFAHPSDVWWKGWFRASDHHRNGLSDAWTCLGYGYAGNVGTQKFANIPPPKTFPK